MCHYLRLVQVILATYVGISHPLRLVYLIHVSHPAPSTPYVLGE
jgi:hypothetical protein